MPKVLIYTTPTCPYCARARALLVSKHIDFKEIDVAIHADKRQEMLERTGRQSVPQIIINQQAVGGCDDLFTLDANGDLEKLLT